MFGGREEQEGACNARITLGNVSTPYCCTFCCTLPEGHRGSHEESTPERNVRVQWEDDDRRSAVWQTWLLYLWDHAGGPEKWEDPPCPPDWDWKKALRIMRGEESAS